jgi:hypothetical protein
MLCVDSDCASHFKIPRPSKKIAFFNASWDPTTDSLSMSEVHSLPHQPVMYYDLTNTSLQHTFPTVASAIIPQWSGQALYFVLLALTGLTQSTSRQYLTYPCSGVNTHGVQDEN